MHDSVWVLGIDRIFSGGGVESSFKKVDHLFQSLVITHKTQVYQLLSVQISTVQPAKISIKKSNSCFAHLQLSPVNQAPNFFLRPGCARAHAMPVVWVGYLLRMIVFRTAQYRLNFCYVTVPYVCSRVHIAVIMCEMCCVTVRPGRVEEIAGRASQRHNCYATTCRTSQVFHW